MSTEAKIVIALISIAFNLWTFWHSQKTERLWRASLGQQAFPLEHRSRRKLTLRLASAMYSIEHGDSQFPLDDRIFLVGRPGKGQNHALPVALYADDAIYVFENIDQCEQIHKAEC